jgi:2-iminobutanoate/2-iminopropanoate deaminase
VRQVIRTDGAPKAIGPYSQGIAVSLAGPARVFYSAGQVALDPATMKLVDGDVAQQTRRVFENLRAVLAAAGLSLADVVKTTVFLTDMAHFAAMNEVYAAQFTGDPPARSTVAVAGLPAGALVEIEVVAVGAA